MNGALEGVLVEQARYYRARAGEYEDWWYRRGRYHHGEAAGDRWWAEVAQLQAQLERCVPSGARVLELACGSGLWTEQLARRARSVTALDGAPEMLELARAKPATQDVRFVAADIFEWQPERAFDVCFFGFWLSHVPSAMMSAFWEKVAAALLPGGRACFFDSARSELASTRGHRLAEPAEELERRRLKDGREYTIVKHWFDQEALTRLLEAQGWCAEVGATGEYFVYGSALPPG